MKITFVILLMFFVFFSDGLNAQEYTQVQIDSIAKSIREKYKVVLKKNFCFQPSICRKNSKNQELSGYKTVF